MASYPVWRGRDGRVAPEDRARFDRAVETSETIEARIVDVEAARGDAFESAGLSAQQAGVALDAAAIAQAQADGALAAAGIADGFAGEADEAAAQAIIHREAAEAARAQTEAYATAAATSARFYDTIALGRAAVTDGHSFGVRAGLADALPRPTIYRRDSSTTQTLIVSILPGSDLDARVRFSAETAIGHAMLSGAGQDIAGHLSPDGSTYDIAGFRFQRTGTAVRLSSYDGLPVDIPGFEGGGAYIGPLTERVDTVEVRVKELEDSPGGAIPEDLSVQTVTVGATLLREAAQSSWRVGDDIVGYFDADGFLITKVKDPDGAPGGGTDLGPLTARVTVVENDLEELEAQVEALTGGGGATAFSAAEIASWDAWAGGWTYNFVNTPHMLQRIEPGALNHFVMAGESFASAQNGSAAPDYHTQVLHPNTYMLGESEHTAIEQTALNTAEQIGAAVLNPLRGTTVSAAASGEPRTVLDAAGFYAAVASEGPSPSNRGESLAIMAIYQMRLMAAAHFGAQQPGDIVLTNVGRSGATVEMWLKGSQLMAGMGSTSPTGVRLYSKLLDTVARMKARADAISKPHRIAGVFWSIGRNNYVHGRDGTLSATRLDGMSQNPLSVATEADYLAASEKIKADFNTDARLISGQARDPSWILDQPDGPYTDDTFKLGIGNATRKFARFDNGVILGAPTYHVPDKNHLDLNGYRWVGCQHGKALFRTLYLGERWKPLEPLKVIWRGSQILIPFHVPVAPLLWREVLDSIGYSSRLYTTRGFRVTAGGADFLTTTPTISPGGRCLILNLDSTPPVAPEVWYASVNGAAANFRGHGNLADSDATLSYASYEFDPDGMHAAANIPSLVGNPYPQNNFCTAFHAVAEHA